MNINNPIQMINLIKNNRNPQEFVLNMVQEQAGNNPLFANLLSLAKNGRGNEIEAIARNMMREKGLDFDVEFNKFRNTIGL